MSKHLQGLGRVAFYSGSFEAAARLYMPEAWRAQHGIGSRRDIFLHAVLRRARSIREKALGGSCTELKLRNWGIDIVQDALCLCGMSKKIKR